MDIAAQPIAAPRRARSGVPAALIGNAVESYDFALFGGFAPVLALVLAPAGWGGFITVFAVFAASCLFRPLGALLLGTRADRSGRRRTLMVTVGLMAVGTFGVGLIPPWSAIGLFAPVLLLAMRSVQAFSVGGETGVAVAFLSDRSPAGRRGRDAGWYVSTIALGLWAGLAVVTTTMAVLDHQDLLSWGWRLPFLLALPLGAVALLLRRRLTDPPEPAGEPAVSPGVVLRKHLPAVVRSFLVTAPYSAGFNIWFVFLPGLLTAKYGVPLSRALIGSLGGLLVAAVTAPIFGRFSDRAGRRRVLLVAVAAFAAAVVPAYLWMLGGSMVALLAGNLVMALLLAAFVLPAYLADQFPAPIRATGLGLGYGLASSLVGGLAPLLASIAVTRAPLSAPIALAVLAVGAIVALVIEARPVGPEPAGGRPGRTAALTSFG